MKTIMFTGVKGVGKSTLVESLANELSLSTADYADFMLEAMNSNNKDEIERLSQAERSRIVQQVRQRLEQLFIMDKQERSQGRFMLLENHLSVVQDSEIVAPSCDVYWRFNLAAICVVFAEPSVIAERRAADVSRNRSIESLSTIAEQQCVNESQARNISTRYSIPLAFFENRDNALPTSDATGWVRSIVNSSH